mmetsp:Transcript_2083/g.2868  ORF Transcript_2083/g.2868 Transcript_2083/m.2868 type:complete len:131 (+) Transcript_2083:31-423(+)
MLGWGIWKLNEHFHREGIVDSQQTDSQLLRRSRRFNSIRRIVIEENLEVLSVSPTFREIFEEVQQNGSNYFLRESISCPLELITPIEKDPFLFLLCVFHDTIEELLLVEKRAESILKDKIDETPTIIRPF